LKVATPIIGAIDPPLGAIFQQVETVLASVLGGKESPTLTAAQVQQIVTSIATLEGIKSKAPSLTTSTTSVTQV
jgi:hypothetical protein